MSVGDLDILRQAFCNAALQKVGEFDRDKFKIDLVVTCPFDWISI